MPEPAVSVVVPTRNRAGYLDVALASLREQEDAPPHELLVVDDGSTDDTVAVAARHGVKAIAAHSPGGINAGRNTGIAATRAELIAFVDDDVWVPPDWLAAMSAGAARFPDAEAFGGPIRGRLIGPAPRSCGREQPPITTLDLGPDDREADFVWGANLTVRRSAIDRVGRFDASLSGNGDEEERGDHPGEKRGRVPPAATSATSPPPGSSTVASATTPGCARSPAPSTTTAARRDATTAARAQRCRCPASCATSPARAGTPRGAAARRG